MAVIWVIPGKHVCLATVIPVHHYFVNRKYAADRERSIRPLHRPLATPEAVPSATALDPRLTARRHRPLLRGIGLDRSAQHAGRGLRDFPELQPRRRRGGGAVARPPRDAGLKAFLDRYALPGGKPWQPELEAALGDCRALVVLLGPAGIGGWQHREIQLGLDRQTAADEPRPRSL